MVQSERDEEVFLSVVFSAFETRRFGLAAAKIHEPAHRKPRRNNGQARVAMTCERAQVGVKVRKSSRAMRSEMMSASRGEKGGEARGQADQRARDPSADSIADRLFLASLLAHSDHASCVSGEEEMGSGVYIVPQRKDGMRAELGRSGKKHA